MTTLYSEIEEETLDANAASFSKSLDIKENSIVCFGAKNESGTHAAHKITLQRSLNDEDWEDTGNVLTGLGIVDNIQTAVRYVRLKVTTVEGSASEVLVRIQAK